MVLSGRNSFSLKKKAILFIVVLIAALIILAGFFCYKGISDTVSTMYMNRAKELSDTAAKLLDPEMVRTLRDEVFRIFNETEEKVSFDGWGTPEHDAYAAKYSWIEETEEFLTIQKQLRIIQDSNHLKSVYLLMFILETEDTVYLADASYEDYSPPGCFDDIMYEVDFEAMEHPENGVAPDITNTEEYGWVVAAGSPVFDRTGELLAFVGVDISMNEIRDQQNHYMAISALFLVALAAVFTVVGIAMVDRFVVRPINILSDTSKKYLQEESSGIRNDFSELQIHTGDEIETLLDSMKLMEASINNHISKLLETTQNLLLTQERADEMGRMANIDGLTKVRNKRAYDVEMQRVNQEIQRGNTNFGLAMIDLNSLKNINDTYGHEKGDISIQTLCGIICNVFHHSPVFRIGGDEFVVLLEDGDLRDLDKLKQEFQQKLDEIRKQPQLMPWERVSAAFGYALFDPEIDNNMDSVFKRADLAMYEQKARMKVLE